MTTVNMKICDECGTCISVCPQDAIVLDKTLRIAADRCTSCGICVKVCPFAALSSGKDKRK